MTYIRKAAPLLEFECADIIPILGPVIERHPIFGITRDVVSFTESISFDAPQHAECTRLAWIMYLAKGRDVTPARWLADRDAPRASRDPQPAAPQRVTGRFLAQTLGRNRGGR